MALALSTGLALAGLGLDAIGGLLGDSAQDKLRRANQEAARTDLALTLEDVRARRDQERQATAQQMASIREQSLTRSAQARVSAAEAGVSGQSYQALLDDVLQNTFEALDTSRMNLDSTLEQSDRVKRGAYAEAKSRMNSVPGSNPLATALSLARTALPIVGNVLQDEMASRRVKPK